MCIKFCIEIPSVAENTAINIKGQLYFAAPCTVLLMEKNSKAV